MSSVGIVIPTLGTRGDYLISCIESIRASGVAHICMVAPEGFSGPAKDLVDQFVVDPMNGLVGAIEAGFSALPESIVYCNWLGDDDLLEPGSLEFAAKLLDANPQAPFVFGGCKYVDPDGKQIWENKSGAWAVPLLRVGPDLIPQPGALFRRSALNKALPMDPGLKLAFDFDLFIKLSKLGKPVFANKVLASFRWHADSLSVSQRRDSVNEASRVRKSHLPAWFRIVSEIWEAPVRFATYRAGMNLNKNR